MRLKKVLAKQCRELSIRCPFKLFLFLLIFGFNTKIANSKYSPILNTQLISTIQKFEDLEFQIKTSLAQMRDSDCSGVTCSKLRQIIETYLLYFDGSNVHSTDNKINCPYKSPTCAFLVISQMKTLLQHLISLKSFPTIFPPLSKKIVYWIWKNGWPAIKDVELTLERILRLQLIYNLNTDELANGLVSSWRTTCVFNSAQSYQIAQTAAKSDQHIFTIEWLELAKDKALMDKKSSIPFIWFALREAIEIHNMDFDAEVKMTMKSIMFFNRKLRHNPGESKKAQKLRNIQYEMFKGNRDKKYTRINYWGLCSGDNYQTFKEKSSLFCWYEFKANPVYAIGPMKMELLSRNPDVIQIYEIVTESQIKSISLGSNIKTLTSSPQGTDVKDNNNYFVGSSKTINPENSALSRKIKQLVTQNMAGMSNSAELLDVQWYLCGDHSLPRVDLKLTGSKNSHKIRIATLNVYLNEVAKGGSTAFTSLGVAATPIKSSAVFSYDILKDGSIDTATARGECPVIFGEKLVAKIWIVANENYLKQSFPSMNKERFQIRVNNVYLPAEIVPPYRENANTQSAEPIIKNSMEQMYLGKYSFLLPFGRKSMAKMQQKIYFEIKNLYNKHKSLTHGTFREEFENENKDVQTFLLDFEESHGLKNTGHWNDEPIKIFEDSPLNPLADYKMVARFLDYLNPWVKTTPSVENKLKTKIIRFVAKTCKNYDKPTHTDLETAMYAILKIQHVHDLAIKDVAGGCVEEICTNIVLNAKDCFRIGKYGIAKNFFMSGIEWLEYALYLAQNTSDNSVKYEDVYDELITGEMLHDEELKNTQWFDYNVFDAPLSQVAQQSKRISRKSVMRRNTEFLHKKHLDIKLWEICKGKNYQTEKEKSKLFCWYEKSIHPSFKIGPIKTELHSMHPAGEVVQYYEIISDRAINYIKNLSYPYFVHSPTWDDTSYPKDPLGSNMSMMSADQNMTRNSETLVKTIKLVERLTGFKTTDGFTVFANVPGSSRGRHIDSVVGDLITFLFYLSDVEKGGETAFIDAGVQVVPKKGSGVFWHNYYSCWSVFQKSRHAACPVIFGEKWTAAPMVMIPAQDHLQCNLRPNVPHETLVNGRSKYKTYM